MRNTMTGKRLPIRDCRSKLILAFILWKFQFVAAGISAASSVQMLQACQPRVELPMVTHYSAGRGGFLEGSTDRSPSGNQNYTFGGFIPGFEDYFAANFSTVALGSRLSTGLFAGEGISDALKYYCLVSGGVRFSLIQGHSDPLRRLISGTEDAQIIHGWVVDGAFVTVILPPGWSATSPPYTYPIVSEAHYDVTDNVFGAFGNARFVIQEVAESARRGRPVVGIIWNGGAAVSSVTANPRAVQQFRSIVASSATLLRADPQRIALIGSSRGGVAALMLAAGSSRSTDPLAYQVREVVAHVPGTKLGTHLDLISATYPAQLGQGLVNLGFNQAWMPGWRYPSGFRPEPFLPGSQANVALGWLYTGKTDFAEIDRLQSPISPTSLVRLRYTRLTLQVGSHDEYIPHATQLEFINRALVAGVDLEAHVVVKGGHRPLPTACVSAVAHWSEQSCGYWTDSYRFDSPSQNAMAYWLRAAIGRLTSTDYRMQAPRRLSRCHPRHEACSPEFEEPTTDQPLSPSFIRYYRVERSTGRLHAGPSIASLKDSCLDPSGSRVRPCVPVQLEVPYAVYPGMPIKAIITAPPGTDVCLRWSIEETVSTSESCAVVGSTFHTAVTLPETTVRGVLVSWALRFRRPDENWRDLDQRNMSGCGPAQFTTYIRRIAAPAVTGVEAWLALRNPAVFACDYETNWGLSEW